MSGGPDSVCPSVRVSVCPSVRLSFMHPSISLWTGLGFGYLMHYEQQSLRVCVSLFLSLSLVVSVPPQVANEKL